MLALREVRHEVAHIDVAAVGRAADAVNALVHAPTETKDERLHRRGELPGEGVALHPRGRLDAGEAQHRRREVHEADQPVACTAGLVFGRREMLPLLREVDDHGNLQAGVAGPALAARHPRAVVGVVEDNRVIREAGVGEFLQVATRVGVHLGDLVVVLRPVLPHLRRVRMIGGHADLGRVLNGDVWSRANLALVALG